MTPEREKEIRKAHDIARDDLRHGYICDIHEAFDEAHQHRAELLEALSELRGLLKVAKCPNTDCTDGAIPHGPDPDGEWSAEQCQWCAERDALIEGESNEE